MLRRLHIPHYVHVATRKPVLDVYRQLQRERTRCIDPLCRSFLQQYIRESFESYKYISSTKKIRALVDLAHIDLQDLRSANKGNSKQLDRLLTWVFCGDLNCEMPLKRFVGNRLSRTLAFRIHNVPHPPVRTFDEYETALASKDGGGELLFQYMKALRANVRSTGKNGRKLFFDVERQVTPLGEPVVRSREKNAVRKCLTRMIEDMPLPFAHETVDYLQNQLKTFDGIRPSKYISKRTYKRKIESLLENGFCVEKDQAAGSIKLIVPRKPPLSPGNRYHSIEPAEGPHSSSSPSTP